MTQKLLLKGGRLLDPASGVDRVADLLVTGSVIGQIGPDLHDPAARVVDCTGRVICPGFIDLHVHLREPGQEWKEDIASGTRAAARGGFVAVACIPNTKPVLDHAQIITWVREKARTEGVVKVWPMGAVTKGQKGDELAEMGEMVEVGAIGFSDDGLPVMNAEVMRLALLYSKQFGVPICAHEEDIHLSQHGAMHLGKYSAILGVRGMDPLAEEVPIARDILLAEATGGHLHVMHVSSRRAVDLIRWGKARGVRLTAEASPHHFTLTDADVAASGYDTNFKMSPPVRSAEDREAIIAGLADGTIDCIATDHAPHHRDDKEKEFPAALNGILGLETAVGLTLDRLVATGRISLEQMVLLMSTNPARIAGQPAPALRVGAEADITVVDPALAWTVDKHSMASRSRNTPFHGWTLNGAPTATVVSGKLVMEEGRLVGY